MSSEVKVLFFCDRQLSRHAFELAQDASVKNLIESVLQERGLIQVGQSVEVDPDDFVMLDLKSGGQLDVRSVSLIGLDEIGLYARNVMGVPSFPPSKMLLILRAQHQGAL